MTSKLINITWKQQFRIVAVVLVALSSSCQQEISSEHTGNASKIILVENDEPGEPIIVDGTVYAQDGKTPVPNIRVYVYHTDSEGKYNWLGLRRPLGMPRIKGTMITDSEGRYEFRSIKPGKYPKRKRKPHVHYKAEGEGYPEQEFKLSIDENATEDPNGFHENRRPRLDEQGVIRFTLNLKLKSELPPP